MGTLADLKGQEWYGRIKQNMNINGVTDPVWESTLLFESGGNPTAHNYNPATGDDSYGLFQLNRAGGLGAGLPPDFLTVPENNTAIASKAMGEAIGKLPKNSTYAEQLRAVENAGWNGSLTQDPARQAALSNVLRQEGFKQSQDASPQDGSTSFTFNPFDALGGQVKQSQKAAAANPGLFGLPDFNQIFSDVGHRVVFYAIVITLIIVGAILILAGVAGQAKDTPIGKAAIFAASKGAV